MAAIEGSNGSHDITGKAPIARAFRTPRALNGSPHAVKYNSMFGCLPTFVVKASTGGIDVGAPSTATPKYFRDGLSSGRTSNGTAGPVDGSGVGCTAFGVAFELFRSTAGSAGSAGFVVHPTKQTRRHRSNADPTPAR